MRRLFLRHVAPPTADRDQRHGDSTDSLDRLNERFGQASYSLERVYYWFARAVWYAARPAPLNYFGFPIGVAPWRGRRESADRPHCECLHAINDFESPLHIACYQSTRRVLRGVESGRRRSGSRRRKQWRE